MAVDGRRSFWWTGARLAAVLVVAVLALGWPWPTSERLGAGVAVAATGGRLLLPRLEGLSVLDLASGAEQRLLTAPPPVLGAAWSPDGAQVALVEYGKRPGDRFGGSDLFLLEQDQTREVVPHDGPDQLVNNPAWTADGQALIYQVSGVTAGGFSVELARLDGSERRTLEASSGYPTISPDGALLAFVRMTGGDALVVRPLAGGAAREVVPQGAFAGLSAPRFSPDGRQIAFFGIGGPAAQQRRAAPSLAALPRLGPAVAWAHGIPWDPWVVNLDGSGLRPLVSLSEDDPTLAWSPDGTMLAALGGNGLWLLDPTGNGEATLLGYGSYGVFDWRP
jgi:Tol biopolymer transport system component